MLFRAFVVLFVIAFTKAESGEMKFDHRQKLRDDFEMEWTIGKNDIVWKLRANTVGWVGIGISPTSTPRSMSGADIVMASVREGKGYILDTMASRNRAPTVDASSDVTLISAGQKDGSTTVIFKRSLSATDADDLPVTPGKMGIIWAFGLTDIVGALSGRHYHGRNRGVASIVLMRPTHKPGASLSKPEPSPTDAMPQKSAFLDADKKVMLEWDVKDMNIEFKLKVKTAGWVGIGITPTSTPRSMAGADIAIAGVMMDTGYILDTMAKGNTSPMVDALQDVTLISAEQKDGYTTVVFTRPLSAADANDLPIMPGKVGIIWAFGSTDIVGGPSSRHYHGQNKGKTSIVLIPITPKTDIHGREGDEDGGDNEEGSSGEHSDGATDVSDSVTGMEGGGPVVWNEESFNHGEMLVRWTSDDKSITFEVTAKTRGWLAIGFSPVRGMTDADIIMCGVKENTPYAYDAFAFGNVLPTVDKEQNVEVISGEQVGSVTTVRFKRNLLSFDPGDRNITTDDLYLIWAIGTHDLVDGPHFVNFHFIYRGSRYLALISDKDEDEEAEEDSDGHAVDEGFLTGGTFLDFDATVSLKWKFDHSSIELELSAPTTGWIGVGFSPGTSMIGADMVMCGVTGSKGYIVDAYGERNGLPIVDNKHNVELLEVDEKDGRTTVKFLRPIVSADQNQDRNITDGRINLIWAYGTMDFNGNPTSSNYHFENKGSIMAQIIPTISFEDFAGGKVELDRDGDVILQWTKVIDTVYFQLSAPGFGWVGLGFCPGKTMKNCDIIMSGVKNEVPYIFDCFSPRNKVPKVDKSQDSMVMAGQEADMKTIVLFQRKIKGNENRRDRDIPEGKTNVIWAYGAKDVDDYPRRNDYHLANRGWMEIELIPATDGMTNME